MRQIKMNIKLRGIVLAILAILIVSATIEFENIVQAATEEEMPPDGVCYLDVERYTVNTIGENNIAPWNYCYVVVVVRIVNNSNKTVSTNPWDWELEADGIIYEHDTATYDSSINHKTVAVGKGGDFTTEFVYLVPRRTNTLGTRYTGYNPPELVVNESLLPENNFALVCGHCFR